jgi:hypothetical protein
MFTSTNKNNEIMAQELATLTATTSVTSFTQESWAETSLEQREMHLTSFAGGIERGGRCLQFTLTSGCEHVQMTRTEVEELVGELTKWLEQ